MRMEEESKTKAIGEGKIQLKRGIKTIEPLKKTSKKIGEKIANNKKVNKWIEKRRP